MTFKCDICKDTEFINGETVTEGGYKYSYVKPCSCVEGKRYLKILEQSGISEAFRQKTLESFKPKNQKQATALKIATEYIKDFDSIRNEKNNGAAFLGQVGSGKTHLTIGIANALLKNGIGVLYMQYREVLTHLKQVKNDEEAYQREINKYKYAPALLMDDLYKGLTRAGKPNESELDIIFEIVNHRYLKGLPILLSSEYFIDDLIEIDEAIGSRLKEMCNCRTVEFLGKALNHRTSQIAVYK